MAGVVIMTLLGLTEALAHARIQRQIDPETGIITYSFHPSPGRRGEKPAPTPVPQTAPDTTPLRTTASTTKQTESRMAPETRIAPTIRLTPSSLTDFPRVSAATQKERDLERLRILKQELAWEEERLVQATENKAAGDVLQRYRANIEALSREIRNGR